MVVFQVGLKNLSKIIIFKIRRKNCQGMQLHSSSIFANLVRMCVERYLMYQLHFIKGQLKFYRISLNYLSGLVDSTGITL